MEKSAKDVVSGGQWHGGISGRYRRIVFKGGICLSADGGGLLPGRLACGAAADCRGSPFTSSEFRSCAVQDRRDIAVYRPNKEGEGPFPRRLSGFLWFFE